MLEKLILSNNPGERKMGHEDRFMHLMEARHRNAMSALQLEQVLSHEEPSDEYPAIKTSENLRAKKEAYETLNPILESLSASGLMQKAEYAKEAVSRYFVEKIRAQRSEVELKAKLRAQGKKATSTEMGSELFRQQTKEGPKNPVLALRREGYFILVFSSDDDYLKFIEGWNRDESAGLFQKSMRFPNIIVNVILSRYGLGHKIILHERQHFINDSILQNFIDIENRSVLPKRDFPLLAKGINKRKLTVIKGLSEVKNELLARIRDGSDSTSAANFFGKSLYKYLRDEFSEDEQKEVGVLLKDIQSELKSALDFFNDDQSRGILVYHLVDISLLRFPERIKAIIRFYNSKIKTG